MDAISDPIPVARIYQSAAAVWCLPYSRGLLKYVAPPRTKRDDVRLRVSARFEYAAYGFMNRWPISFFIVFRSVLMAYGYLSRWPRVREHASDRKVAEFNGFTPHRQFLTAQSSSLKCSQTPFVQCVRKNVPRNVPQVYPGTIKCFPGRGIKTKKINDLWCPRRDLNTRPTV